MIMVKLRKMEEMEQFLKKANKPFYIQKRRIYHAAHDVGYCLRGIFYQWQGVKLEREFDPDISQAGKDVENLIIEKCKIARIFVASSVRSSSDELRMSYEIDIVIADPFHKDIPVPVEVKSCNHRSFSTYYDTFCPHCRSKVYYKATECRRCNKDFPDPIREVKINEDGSKSWGYEDQPAQSHIWQLMIYIMDNNFPHGYIVYKNKNTSQEAWFLVEADPIIWDKIRAKLRQLNDYVVKNEAPERPFKATWLDDGEMDKKHSARECITCPFPRHCWGKNIDEKQ